MYFNTFLFKFDAIPPILDLYGVYSVMQHVGVVIIGGGLAGLSCAIQLVRQNLEVVVVEKKEYPFHRVCGEYISNEVTPFLQRLEIYPDQFEPPQIKKLQLTAVGGYQATMDLPLGGFGISRYQLDYFLYKRALESRGEIYHP